MIKKSQVVVSPLKFLESGNYLLKFFKKANEAKALILNYIG